VLLIDHCSGHKHYSTSCRCFCLLTLLLLLLLPLHFSPAAAVLRLVLQVPVKDRPGHFVMTYHMDVRHTEPVESVLGNSLTKQKGQEGVYSPMGDWNSNSQQEMLERAMSNGRVPANAW
jgi:hypothetical protein